MRVAILLVLLLGPLANASELVIHVPTTTHVSVATAKSSTGTVTGTIAADGVHFTTLKPGEKYDIALESADGHIDQGVDSGWYDSEPADPNAAPMDDDDRQQIHSILTEIKSFNDRTESLETWGDHNRAVVLVQRIRDSKFHSDTGGQAIWRVELWYLKNEAGGWAKVNQQDRVLRRERFDSTDKMKQAIEKLDWRAELGGVKVAKDETKTVELKTVEKK
jgi:hypothetical protein